MTVGDTNSIRLNKFFIYKKIKKAKGARNVQNKLNCPRQIKKVTKKKKPFSHKIKKKKRSYGQHLKYLKLVLV